MVTSIIERPQYAAPPPDSEKPSVHVFFSFTHYLPAAPVELFSITICPKKQRPTPSIERWAGEGDQYAAPLPQKANRFARKPGGAADGSLNPFAQDNPNNNSLQEQDFLRRGRGC